jgi:hypothetical protein
MAELKLGDDVLVLEIKRSSSGFPDLKLRQGLVINFDDTVVSVQHEGWFGYWAALYPRGQVFTSICDFYRLLGR